MSNLRFVDTNELNVCERKKQLRTYMKRRRADNENRDVKEKLLTQNFLNLFESVFKEKISSGKTINCFCYLSYSAEAGTDTLVEALQARGVRVFAPRVEGSEMVAVAIGEDYAISKWGIREPLGEAYTGEIDCIVLPLLAVDKKGNRLGYGGGYYDKFLSKHKQAVTVAYCYDFQVINSVPIEETDESVQYIATDKLWMKTEKNERKKKV